MIFFACTVEIARSATGVGAGAVLATGLTGLDDFLFSCALAFFGDWVFVLDFIGDDTFLG